MTLLIFNVARIYTHTTLHCISALLFFLSYFIMEVIFKKVIIWYCIQFLIFVEIRVVTFLGGAGII